MKRIPNEVLIFDILMFAAIISWIFLPIFEINSINYVQAITPLGFVITFFGAKSLFISPLTITSIVFFIFSAILPLVWRSSRYSLYTSTVSAFFGVIMIVNAFIFQERYLHFYGYSVVPTSNGAFYIQFPSSTVYNPPLYLLISSSALSLVNSLTRARWLPYRRLTLLEKLNSELQRGEIIKGFLSFVSSLGVYASVGDKYIKVKDFAIIQGKPKVEEKKRDISMFFPSGEQFFIGKDKILHVDSEGEIHYYNLDQGLKLLLTKIIEKSDFNNELYSDSLYR